uniref:Serine/threonine-protein kinase PRP4 homolog n=1 Tax=Dermatophagoides pteronyssinus TaxID=6956 RepID=A0A6P6YH16_DERPT|nr:serine/threonine-protein kinase PRP4 homolog [Dermatophagoides pteronyssinus]
MSRKIQEFKSIKTMPSPISLHEPCTRKNHLLQEFYDEIDSTPEKGEVGSEFILYYMIGATIVRPMGIFSGQINRKYSEINQYVLRRSNGQLAWLPYQSSNPALKADYLYITEHATARSRLFNLLVIPENGPKNPEVFVYGEMFAGFSFEAPGSLELKGHIFMTHMYPEPNVCAVEDQLESDIIIEITAGTIIVFICDDKDIVILPGDDCKMRFSAENEQVLDQFQKTQKPFSRVLSPPVIYGQNESNKIAEQKKSPKEDDNSTKTKHDSLSELLKLIDQQKTEKTSPAEIRLKGEMGKKPDDCVASKKQSILSPQIPEDFQRPLESPPQVIVEETGELNPSNESSKKKRKRKKSLKLNQIPIKDIDISTKPNRKTYMDSSPSDNKAEDKIPKQHISPLEHLKSKSLIQQTEEPSILSSNKSGSLIQIRDDNQKNKSLTFKETESVGSFSPLLSSPSKSKKSKDKSERRNGDDKKKSRSKDKLSSSKSNLRKRSKVSARRRRRHRSRDSVVKMTRSKLADSMLQSRSLATNSSSFSPINSDLLKRVAKNVSIGRKGSKLRQSPLEKVNSESRKKKSPDSSSIGQKCKSIRTMKNSFESRLSAVRKALDFFQSDSISIRKLRRTIQKTVDLGMKLSERTLQENCLDPNINLKLDSYLRLLREKVNHLENVDDESNTKQQQIEILSSIFDCVHNIQDIVQKIEPRSSNSLSPSTTS